VGTADAVAGRFITLDRGLKNKHPRTTITFVQRIRPYGGAVDFHRYSLFESQTKTIMTTTTRGFLTSFHVFIGCSKRKRLQPLPVLQILTSAS
jgi:hypothetical protein